MKNKNLQIIMVAPQPFFTARGTPFSVLHRIRALVTKGHKVDLITYPFGEDIKMDGLRIIRCRSLPFIKRIKIGPSIPKILLDVMLFFETRKAVRNNQYDLIHSHEEAAFFCVPLSKKHRLVHIYDMHSSLPQQLSNFRAYNFRLFRSIFERLERYVLTNCDGIITICDDLARVVEKQCPTKPHSMIENIGDDRKVFTPKPENLVEQLSLKGKKIVLYTGTFEAYQGLDLLLESTAKIVNKIPEVVLVMVGGTAGQVEHYRQLSKNLGIENITHFTGTVHPSRIPNFLDIADVIVSPRSRGTNTPLKIYGYMRTLVPLVATDRHTHTQILNQDMAELVSADSDGLSKGVIRILSDPNRANELASNAKEFADNNFSDDKFMEMVNGIYEKVIDHHPATENYR